MPMSTTADGLPVGTPAQRVVNEAVTTFERTGGVRVEPAACDALIGALENNREFLDRYDAATHALAVQSAIGVLQQAAERERELGVAGFSEARLSVTLSTITAFRWPYPFGPA